MFGHGAAVVLQVDVGVVEDSGDFEARISSHFLLFDERIFYLFVLHQGQSRQNRSFVATRHFRTQILRQSDPWHLY